MFQLERNVLSTNARVTRFAIDWGDSEVTAEAAANGLAPNDAEAQKSLETDFEIQNKENKLQQPINAVSQQTTCDQQHSTNPTGKVVENSEKTPNEEREAVELMETNAQAAEVA